MAGALTADELIRRKLVPAEKKAELEQYLQARERFLGFFGSRSKAEEEAAQALEALDTAADRFRAAQRRIAQHIEFLNKEVLPTVELLVEPEEWTQIQGEMVLLDAFARDQVGLERAQAWLRAFLEQNDYVSRRLMILRRQLGGT